MVKTMRTGFVCEELYFWHDNGSALLEIPSGGFYQPGPHVETPESKRRFRNLLDVSGLLEDLHKLKVLPATEEDVLRFHTKNHLTALKEASSLPGSRPFGDGCSVSLGSYEIAMLSAGGAIAGVMAVMGGEIDNAYVLNRPPGHHALSDLAMGFCLLGNIPIAIRHAQSGGHVGKVAVVDWDVHHGNGTESAFIDRDDVLTISLHQDGNYPVDTGGKNIIGTGKGEGFNINIPLPPGSGSGAYFHAMEQIVLPALERFEPDLIMVASGFDASIYDPLGCQMLHSEAYRQMTKLLMKSAHNLCNDRLVMTHEGGYSEAYVPLCGLAVLEELSGVKTDVVDPYLSSVANFTYQLLQPGQKEVVDEIRAIHDL